MVESITREALKEYAAAVERRAASNPAPQPERSRGIQPSTEETRSLLNDCSNYYDGLDSIRRSRGRNLRYRNGDQWSDYVVDPDGGGEMVKEEEVISRGGKIPLKYNFISQYVRNLTGQLLASPSQSVVYARGRDEDTLSLMLTNALQAAHALNNTAKLDIAILEELLLAGMGCIKIRYDMLSDKNRYDATISMVNTNRLFFNADIEDPRMNDIRVIGELHDYTFDDLIHNFARNRGDEKLLAKIYGHGGSRSYYESTLASLYGMSGEHLRSISFFTSDEPTKYRVVEMWQRKGRWVNYIHDWIDGTQQQSTMAKAEVDRINKARLEMATEEGLDKEFVPLIDFERRYEYYWEVLHLAPTGEILRRQETPFDHQVHPYVLALMPMTDGQLRSSISDLIDIQRYINRLIVMIDFILGTSAKGVLMIPENSIPDGYTVEDFADEYVKTNGVILYKPTAQNVAPHQITSNSSAASAQAMLSLQMDLMRQISGMSGAMQGMQPPSGTPSSLYAQQTENGLLNHKVIFESMKQYRSLRDEKLLRVITQYYAQPRYMAIGSDKLSVSLYDPEKVKEMVDFGVVVSQSHDTPIYRQSFDDLMLSLLNRGHITSEIFLRNCSLPFADKLLLDLDALKQETKEQADAELALKAELTKMEQSEELPS